MSDLRDFLSSRILRNPTTWMIATVAFIYGGYVMVGVRELRRAEGAPLQTPYLATDRALDFVFGGGIQVLFVMCAVWLVAGLLEDANVWVRQSLVALAYIGMVVITRLL